MTRKKVKLAFITNDPARKATYKKRKRGLLKKMDELTTLCDVKACAILYSPYEARPVVWPGPSGARDVIASFKRLPEMEKVKKMVSQEEFIRLRVAKAYEQLKRQQKDNREKEMSEIMYQCLSGEIINNMSLLDLSDLGWVINQHLSEINKRIKGFKKGAPSSNINTNINHNNNNIETSITNNISGNIQLASALSPYYQQVMVDPEMESEVLQRQKEDFDAMQMMVQPWSSFMDMMGPSMELNHHHKHPHAHPHHEYGGANGYARNSDNNSMNMVMMMGQFGEYHSHDVNPAIWSNAYFP